MEFVAKKKKLKLTVNGESFEFNAPTVLDQESLKEKLKEAKEIDAAEVYYSFFESLGLPKNASKSMDFDDFMDFIQFIFNPKKK